MKKVAAFIFLFLLAPLFCLQPILCQPQYRGNVFVNAGGTVTPSSAPIVQSGKTYTLNGDIQGTITTKANNTAFDGNGHRIGSFSVNGVSNVTVKNFVMTDFTDVARMEPVVGIDLTNSSNDLIANNTIEGIWGLLEMSGGIFAGIAVWQGGSNTIIGNTLSDDAYGIFLEGTQNNLIAGNRIADHSNLSNLAVCAIYVDYSSHNRIYHNDFLDKAEFLNGKQVENIWSNNTWDDGYPGGGNYWIDYVSQSPKEISRSGIGDKPHTIDQNNADRYPLMQPFKSTFFALQTTPPKVSIQSPANQTYDGSSVPLVFSTEVFSADKAINWLSYSLDDESNVTVNGNSTLAGLSNGLHSITVYANDTYGNVSASQAINFTVQNPEAFSNARLIMVIAVSVVTVAIIGILVYFRRSYSIRRSMSEK